MITTRAQEQQLTMLRPRDAFLGDRTFDASESAGPEGLPTRSVFSRNYGSLPLVPGKRIETREFFGSLAFLRLGLRESDTLRARR
jgi:hypothetical protein